MSAAPQGSGAVWDARADRPRVRGRARAWVLSLVALVAVTLLLVAGRGRLDKSHIVLGYLLVVLGGSAAGGRTLGITLAALAFLLFNLLFLPPYYTLTIADPLDWLVLVAFLVTGIVAAQLLSRAEERAQVARQRAIEVERLAALGAETLNAGRAEDALAAVATVIGGALGVRCCEVLTPVAPPAIALVAAARAGRCEAGAGDDAMATWVMARGAPSGRRADGTRWLGVPPTPAMPAGGVTERDDVRVLMLPLAVRERTVGVLRLAHDAPIALDPAQRQFLAALSYYAALGVERVRLAAAAERAEAFRQADALKTALIATVSHDLRTPLTTIKALAHRLARTGEEDALSIEEEADRLNGFVADLLDLSRLSAGAVPLRIELNVLDELVASAVDRVRGLLGDRAVLVRRGPDAGEHGILFGTFDLVQSIRVLVNLLENAIKYSPPGAPIELEVGRVEDRLRIAVMDRGPGLPAADEALVFEPFYRAHGLPPDVGGAGLGLAIARGLAEAQNGTLAYVAREGGGSTFVLELPAAEPPALADYPGVTTPG